VSENNFYADLDKINEKGVLVTGHGKGLVSKNPNINGDYIANDMVRLELQNNQLFGYQGYILKENNDLTKIEYLLYFYAQDEPNQPSSPTVISAENYLSLCKHCIERGDLINDNYFSFDKSDKNTYCEFKEIIMQIGDVSFLFYPIYTRRG